MRLRRTAALAAMTIVVLVALPAGPARAQAGSTAPDIVLVVTDDQRWDTLEAMPVVSERLAGMGVTFPDAFVTNPLCCPSRASILTGDLSHTHLVYRQAPPFGRFEWFDDTSTLATWLHDAGYTTGLFGKYIDGFQHAALTGYVPPGWDRWAAFVRSAAVDYALTVDREVRRFEGAGEHSTGVLAREAVEFVRSAEGPMFLVFAPASPHAPATPMPQDAGAFAQLEPARPPSFDEPDVSDKPAWVRALPRLDPAQVASIDALRRDELRSLLGVDRAVGDILDALEETGRLENTLVVFTSDNGLLHGEHRWTKKEAPYDEAIRVPLVLRWDSAGWVTGAELSGVLALNIDLAPTIAEAAGAAHPRTDGRSLLPVAEGNLQGWRTDFLVEHMEGSNPVPTYCAVRSDRWMYVRYETGEEELYDLESDPFQLDNRARDAALADVVAERRARLGELCVPPPPGMEHRSGGWVVLAGGVLVVLALLEALATRRGAAKPEAPGRLGRR